MTTSGLASPPRAAPPRRTRPEPKPLPAKPPGPPRRSFERILGWSLAGSLLVHLLLLLLSPLVIRFDLPIIGGGAVPAEAPQSFGLEMIVAIPSENAPEFPPVEERTEVPPLVRPPTATTPFTPAPGAPPIPGAPAPPGPGGESAADVLRPGFRDSRLYVAPRPLPGIERTEHERYMEHLQARIDAVNDSMNVAANRERRTSDWTFTDGSGNRWGLSPDGVHLGGVTIPRELLPLPGATGDNQSVQAEQERQRQRDEIRQQEDARERDRIREERNRNQGRPADGGATQ